MSVKCALCGQRTAGRSCPARWESVCSWCCGRERTRSIDCPSDCEFLRAGRIRAFRRLAGLLGDADFEYEWFGVLHNLRLVLVRCRRKMVQGLNDGEALEAAKNAAETSRTRSKGLIYEFRSQNPRVQTVTDELCQLMSWHEKGERELARFGPAELARCLHYLSRQIEKAIAKGESFLDLAAQTVDPELYVRVDEERRRNRPPRQNR